MVETCIRRQLHVNASVGELVADECNDCFWCALQVGCGKSKESETGRQQAVLAPVVLGYAVSMSGAVVFERQSFGAVQEIRTSYEPAAVVVQCDLDFRSRQTIEHQQQAQPGLHGGLGCAIGEPERSSEPHDSLRAG